MSGIQFASEGENLSLGSRPRPKKRRSSILKSPSRNALNDLDPNAEERETASFAKKKRRSSRRVSFANTYQVQEFLTANQLKILEDTNTETAQPISPERDVQQSAYSTTLAGCSEQDARCSQTLQPDISVGPGHCIRGLETLLSGPIKNPCCSHQEPICSDPMVPQAVLQTRDAAPQLPMIDETCELPATVQVGNGTDKSSDPPPHETDGTQAWPELADDHDNLTVGLVGPRYHCVLPVSESFSSSYQASFSSSCAASANHSVNLDDTANFELTLCREQYLATGMVYGESSSAAVRKQDASSFLKSFMETDQADESCRQPAQSTFQPYTDAHDVENQPPKLDSGDFLKSFTPSSSPQSSFPAPSACPGVSLDSSPKKQDAKSFLKSLFGGESWPPPDTATAEETCIFTQSESAAEMDLTACISVNEAEEGWKEIKDASLFLKSGGVTASSTKANEHHATCQRVGVSGDDDKVTSGMHVTAGVGGVLQAAEASALQANNHDVTVRFGGDHTGSMEFTQCIGGIQDQCGCDKPSSQKRGRGARPLEDITQIFDGAQIDLTVCTNPLASNVSQYPHSTTGDGQTRTCHQEDSTAAMEMTSCLHNETKPDTMKDVSNRVYPDVRVEKTEIFHHDDINAAMEMTTCLASQDTFVRPRNRSIDTDSSNTTQPNRTVETTRIFRYDDTNAAMDLTSCLNGKPGSLSSGSCNSDSSNPLHPDEGVEKTRIFHQDEMTAAMEMTTCLGSFNSKTSSKKGPSLDSNEPAAVEETRFFQHDDATAAMDETECLDERSRFANYGADISQSNTAQHPSRIETAQGTFQEAQTTQAQRKLALDTDPIKEPVVGDNLGADKTQMFQAEDATGMDFTTCVGGMLLAPCSPREIPAKKSSTTDAKQMNTSHSSDGEIPKLAPEVDRDSSRALPRYHQGDSTRNFTSDDTARMEMTACIGGVLMSTGPRHSPSQQVDKTQIFTQDDMAQMELTTCLSSLKPLPSMVPTSDSHHATCPDETSKMEMTACVGGIFPKMFVESSQDKAAKQLGDHTKIFSTDDTARMDMTHCIGDLHLQSLAMETQSDDVGDHTKVFGSEDTARMEMTTCMGGLAPPDVTAAVPDSPVIPRSSMSPPGETGSLTRSHPQELYPPEQTSIFHSDSNAAMEITTCIGGIHQNAPSTRHQPEEAFRDISLSTRPLSEHTHLFAHGNEGKMDLTTCIGGIEGRDLTQSTPGASASPPSDSTRLFSHEETSKMELTRCVGVSDLTSKDLSSGQHLHYALPFQAPVNQTTKSTNLLSHDTEQQMKLAHAKMILDESEQCGEKSGDKNEPISMSSTDATEADRSEDKCHGSPVLMQSIDPDQTPTKEAHPSKRNSDTFTIESSASGATELTTRRSGTYTLDKPPTASPVPQHPAAAIDGQTDDSDSPAGEASKQGIPGEEVASLVGDLNRWGSLDSADGIDNEQPMWVENTEDFVQLSAEAGVACLMLMEAIKDKTDSEGLPELPTLARDNAQEEIQASQMQYMDILNRPGEVVPPTAPVSMQDFLAFVTLNMPKGRRSVLPCVPKAAAPKSLSNFMEEHFILKPKKELYEWAVSHLSSSIEKMQEAVSEQERRMSADNPQIVTEVQRASPEKAAELHEHIESLHKACSKMSGSSFQEWRLKMVNKTHRSFKQTEEEMNSVFDSLSSSLDTLNKNLEELGKFKEGLDGTLARLRSVEPPREEQVKEFIDRQNQLTEKRAAIEAMEQDKATLEQESLSLKSDIKKYEKELGDLREQELMLSNQASPEYNLEEAIVKLEDLHCLQEWRLRKNTKEELVFTFLADTVVFTVKLGQDIDDGDGNGINHQAISGIHIESILTDNADVCAQLAHNLILASIDAASLHSQHPTTVSLKSLLQEMSTVVSHADGIADEMDKIKYRHVVTLDGINPTVEFSNLDAFVKFWVTFHLPPSGYPFRAIAAGFKHKIGKLRNEDVQSSLSQVKPGWTYMTRLVRSIDTLIQRHIPSDL